MHHFRSLKILKSDLNKNKKPHKNAVQWHNNLRLINQYFNKMNNLIKIKTTIKTIEKSIFIIFLQVSSKANRGNLAYIFYDHHKLY
jgi:hypothetical protein